MIRATKKRNRYKEVRLKFWAYNKLKEIGWEKIRN
jgi:hypothetical protein